MFACGSSGGSGGGTARSYPATGLVLLSSQDGAVRASASIGTDPVAVIVSDDGRTAYMADSAPGDVYAVSLPDLKTIWKQHVGGAPFGLLLHGGRLAVSLFNSAAVVELDLAEGHLLATHATSQGPAAMTLDSSGRVAVAGTRGVVDYLDGSSIPAGHGFGIALVGSTLWTADYERAELVDAGTGRRVGMPVPIFPFWLSAGSGGALLISAEGANEDTDPGGVFSYDAMDGSFKTLARPRDPDQVVESGSTVLVAAHGDHNVLAIRGGRVEVWARGVSAVGVAGDVPLGLVALVVNAHE